MTPPDPLQTEVERLVAELQADVQQTQQSAQGILLLAEALLEAAESIGPLLDASDSAQWH
jgi:cytochrome c-type biogenesis protein CcmH/NrfG